MAQGKKRQAPQKNKSIPAPGAGTPQSSLVIFPHGAVARTSTHDSIEGRVLDLYFLMPAGVCTVRLPVGAWPAVHEAVQAALAEIPEEVERAAAQQRAHQAGLVVAAGNADVAREAAAREQLKKGPTE